MEGKLKQCPLCELWLPLKKFKTNPDGSIRKHTCKACISKRTNTIQKLKVFKAFGNKCNCCGETQPYFLTVDHVQNNGAEHKREIGSDNVYMIYKQVIADNFDPLKWQLLCMNCNFAKGHYGECPHVSKKTSEMVLEELKSRIRYTGKALQNMNLEPLKLGPLSTKLDPTVLREHRLQNSKKQKAKQVTKDLINQMLQSGNFTIEDITKLINK